MSRTLLPSSASARIWESSSSRSITSTGSTGLVIWNGLITRRSLPVAQIFVPYGSYFRATLAQIFVPLWLMVRQDERPLSSAPGRFEEQKMRSDRPYGSSLATPIGQETPVPPRPQYPLGFFARYCWWYS